jgi:hypothetical protein
MLSVVGLRLGDKKDITVKGLEAVHGACRYQNPPESVSGGKKVATHTSG